MEKTSHSTDSSNEEGFITKFDRLEKAKKEANGIYKAGKYREALESYTRLIAEISEIQPESADLHQLTEAVEKKALSDSRLVDLAAALLCNAALCYFNLKCIEETTVLCNACLRVDAYNYKAVYYLAQCSLGRKQYKEALEFVERCQHIVDAKGLYVNQDKPHAALVLKINECMRREDLTKVQGCSVDDILSNIASGNALTLNLQRLNCCPKKEIINKKVLHRLITILKEKYDHVENVELHSGIWCLIHQMFYRVEEKVEREMLEQLKGAMDEHDIEPLNYAKQVIQIAERNSAIANSVKSILIQFSKACSDLRTISSLEALTLLLERCSSETEDHVITAIWYYFTNMRSYEKPVEDRGFTSAVTKMLETLMSYYDLENHQEKEEKIDGCIVALFLRRFGKYEIGDETFMSIVDRLLNGYITMGVSEVEGGIFMQPTWYVAMRSLYVSSREYFKAYMISNELMVPLLANYMSSYNGEYDRIRLQLLQSELIVLCMDFLEFRQQIIDATVQGTSIIEFLKNDIGFIKYLEEIRNSESALQEYCKELKHEFSCTLRKDLGKRVHEQKLLALSKFMVHSSDAMTLILDSFDMFYLVPRAVVSAIKDGLNVDILVEAMSHITLHKEAKTVDILKFLYIQLLFLDSGVHCTDKTIYMICHSFVNLFRSKADRSRFNKDAQSGQIYDDAQMESLHEVYDKLPAASKPAINGHFDEGTIEVANAVRESAVVMNNDLPRCLISVAKRILKDRVNEAEYDAKNENKLPPCARSHILIFEALHYLVTPPINRPLMQSAGVLRAFIDAVSSKIYRGTNKCRYLSQSIAHLCIAFSPRTLSYRDALDAARPLVTLLGDENELFQYEAALGLTNLLTIDDSVRLRVWSIGGWDALGNLLFSNNDQLKAAGLEGWCNIAAGEDVIHGHFHQKILEQLKSVEDFNQLITLDIHDINILLMFAANVTDLRSVTASTGALALLARDLRIAKYMPFFSRISNMSTAMDALDNINILYRILTFMGCVMQGVAEKFSQTNRLHAKNVKEQIQQCVKRNMAKFKTEATIKSAREILEHRTY